MMSDVLKSTLAELTDIQRQAVDWDNGALLVLAGPGSGKTRVLTCRIARLLDSSRDQHFRILALTFTNKAANEMANRVAALAPGLEERANISTFHSFCAQVLRQHGIHLDIKSDFTIYSQEADRRAVLEDALNRDGRNASHRDMRLLPLIDYLKGQFVTPENAEQVVDSMNGATIDPSRVAHIYRLYEKELRRINALDFNSLIFETHRLFEYPAITQHYQMTYRYWLVDEFQDTNGSQYRLLRCMSIQDFREIFAVADDDQTIFGWNGADVRRIHNLVKDFSCRVIQLPTNFRCPPRIVEAANRLVAYNAQRVKEKQPTSPDQSNYFLSTEEQIQYRNFDTDKEEVAQIAAEIACYDINARSETAVLARTRKLLEPMQEALHNYSISAEITMRRDDFASPQVRWLLHCLTQIRRPLDRHNMMMLADAFASFAPLSVNLDGIISRSETEGVTYLKVWLESVQETAAACPFTEVIDMIAKLAAGEARFGSTIQQILKHLEDNDPDEDLKDDLSAWRRIEGEIKDAQQVESLDQFLQEMQLRSKEPIPAPGTVSLTTIHGAKGREFDTVYLIGMAEEILPSWHSVNKGADSFALEEERRGCFVAITRTKKRLILSYARQYGGWPKSPSRFLDEMNVPGRDP